MSKTTHGPWRVESGGFVGGPAGFGHVCQLWNKYEEDFQNAEANARLIAAAPDLLAACNRFEPVLVWLESLQDGTLGRDLAKQLRPVMEAAIAKAEKV